MADPVDETHIYMCVFAPGLRPLSGVRALRTQFSPTPLPRERTDHGRGNTGMNAATKPENPLERGRWAGEKSRIRESIVAPIDEWREENVKGREPENDFWTVAG